jgi:hypothetical protein
MLEQTVREADARLDRALLAYAHRDFPRGDDMVISAGLEYRKGSAEASGQRVMEVSRHVKTRVAQAALIASASDPAKEARASRATFGVVEPEHPKAAEPEGPTLQEDACAADDALSNAICAYGQGDVALADQGVIVAGGRYTEAVAKWGVEPVVRASRHPDPLVILAGVIAASQDRAAAVRQARGILGFKEEQPAPKPDPPKAQPKSRPQAPPVPERGAKGGWGWIVGTLLAAGFGLYIAASNLPSDTANVSAQPSDTSTPLRAPPRTGPTVNPPAPEPETTAVNPPAADPPSAPAPTTSPAPPTAIDAVCDYDGDGSGIKRWVPIYDGDRGVIGDRQLYQTGAGSFGQP